MLGTIVCRDHSWITVDIVPASTIWIPSTYPSLPLRLLDIPSSPCKVLSSSSESLNHCASPYCTTIATIFWWWWWYLPTKGLFSLNIITYSLSYDPRFLLVRNVNYTCNMYNAYILLRTIQQVYMETSLAEIDTSSYIYELSSQVRSFARAVYWWYCVSIWKAGFLMFLRLVALISHHLRPSGIHWEVANDMRSARPMSTCFSVSRTHIIVMLRFGFWGI